MMRSLLLLLSPFLLFGCAKPVPPLFQEPVPYSSPSGPAALGQRLTAGPTGDVLLSWIDRDEVGGTLRVSRLGDSGWSEPRVVTSDPKMFVNWADFPSVTALGGGRWIAHWLRYSADLVYSYDVVVSHSTDSGATWSPPVSPHADGTPTEHGFVSLWPASDVTGLVWLDGRKTGNEHADDPMASGMTLRAATIDHEGGINAEQEIDALVCDCCQTDIAVATSGPIVVYRDRTPGEIRDISISRYVDGRWQPPQALSNDGWEIAGCPVNGPAIAAHGDLVAVAWFTAARNSPIVKARISKNGGKTFGDTIIIDTGRPLGHVDVTYIGDSSFAISWMKHGDRLHDILLRSLTSEGELSLYKTAGRTAVSHNVPQMVEQDGKLIMAWTDRIRDESRIGAVSLEINYAE